MLNNIYIPYICDFWYLSTTHASKTQWHVRDSAFHFWNCLMLEFLSPNSRALLPIFRTNCPDGSHFAQMGSHFAQITTHNPCSLLSPSTPLSGICTHTEHPQAHPNTVTPLSLA